jgi:hypothetical protein
MKTKSFDELCRSIDWLAMEKARKTIKNLAKTRPTLRSLVVFMDALVDSATEVHGIHENKVYPSAVKAVLVTKAKQQKN